METESVSRTMQRLERYIMALPKAKHLNMLGTAQREAMTNLRDTAAAARSSVMSYQMTDDSAEQAVALRASIDYVIATDKAIIFASQFDLLDAADVAHLSALAQHIRERLV